MKIVAYMLIALLKIKLILYGPSLNLVKIAVFHFVILIFQVALGEMNELLYSDYNANNLPKGKLRYISLSQ